MTEEAIDRDSPYHRRIKTIEGINYEVGISCPGDGTGYLTDTIDVDEEMDSREIRQAIRDAIKDLQRERKAMEKQEAEPDFPEEFEDLGPEEFEDLGPEEFGNLSPEEFEDLEFE